MKASLRGHWCAAHNSDAWSKVGTITYDRITFSDSNMNITDTPLDINTGINSQKCYYYQDIDICHLSGIFTVPVSGAWKISFSLLSKQESGEFTKAGIHFNGNIMYETVHRTYSASGKVESTGGRVVTQKASAGDQIEIRTTSMEGTYFYVLFCVEYISKM